MGIALLSIIFLGKTFGWANGTDVQFSIETIKYFAGWADKITGQTIEVLLAFPSEYPV
jgi:aldehyde dehydrogenase (NAD+)